MKIQMIIDNATHDQNV